MKMLLRASHINVIVFVLFGLARGAYLIDFSTVFHRNLANVKREGKFCGISALDSPSPKAKFLDRFEKILRVTMMK